MATYLITHEVDDVDHWWSSPKREEVFGPLGITLQTEVAAEAIRFDKVRIDTLVVHEGE